MAQREIRRVRAGFADGGRQPRAKAGGKAALKGEKARERILPGHFPTEPTLLKPSCEPSETQFGLLTSGTVR